MHFKLDEKLIIRWISHQSTQSIVIIHQDRIRNQPICLDPKSDDLLVHFYAHRDWMDQPDRIWNKSVNLYIFMLNAHPDSDTVSLFFGHD